MKMPAFTTATVILFPLILLSCAPAKKDIVKHSWKHDHGYRIGDWIEFGKSIYNLDDELNIYKDNHKVAVVIEADGREMIIESIETKEKGRYVSKGKRD